MDRRTEGWKNVQTLFYRILPATAAGPIKSLKFSWIKKLYDSKHHEWKIIHLHLINTYLRKNLEFHSNLDTSCQKVK